MVIDESSRTAFNNPQAADEHDREAQRYEKLAADTCGWLYMGFLHAAEAHRAAARRIRASSTPELLP
jgi:hypothetical protein